MKKERYKIKHIVKLIGDGPMFFELYDNLNKKYFESPNDIVKVLNQQDTRIIELEEQNGYIIFADGYDDNGNKVSKQVYTTYKSKCDELIKENKQLTNQYDLLNKKYCEEMDKNIALKEQLEEKNKEIKKLSLYSEKLYKLEARIGLEERTVGDVVEELDRLRNQLELSQKENMQLKQQLSYEENAHDLCIDRFNEECEKLRKQIKFESEARERFKLENQQLNQQLKKENEILKKVVDFINELAWHDVKYDAFQSTMGEFPASPSAIPRYAKKYFDLWKEIFNENLEDKIKNWEQNNGRIYKK